ncbi:hypothetical protein [Methylibium sp.]|uniref:hypothetical protein n=1 Tax=Methylibium sp. TaxID=2067992 RepID=UPI00286C58F7|nr:hypothetical protein [Methylibium sp.]
MTHDGNKASGTGHTVTPYRAHRNAVGGNAFCMPALSAVAVPRPPTAARTANSGVRSMKARR